MLASRLSTMAIGVHHMHIDVCENPFSVALSESGNRIKALSAGRVDTFSRWWKLSQKCFWDFFKHSRGRTIHKSFSFPSTWLEFWLLSLATKWCIFKMGMVAWNHPSILSRFKSYLLSIPGLITLTFKALITAQFASLSSSYWWLKLLLCSA